MMRVFHPKDIKKDDSLRLFPWVYLGSDHGLKHVSQVLDAGRRRFLGREIEETSEASRQDFIDYIGRISAKQPDKLLWYSTCVASKSISRSGIFQQYVYMKVLDKIASENKDILFISDDKELLGAIAKIRGLALTSAAKITFRERAARVCAVHKRNFKYLLLWVLSHVYCGRTSFKSPCVLIYTPLDRRALTGPAGFNDNYFGGLGSFLSGLGYNVYRVLPLDISFSVFLRSRRYFKNIIHPFSYISILKLIKVLLTRLAIRTDIELTGKQGDSSVLDVLIKEEIRNEAGSGSFQSDLLHYYAYAGINREISSRDSFVYIFENQPWEKMVNMALTKAKRIGYQHTVISSNWLDYRVSEFEKDMPLPSVILASGDKWLEFLNQYYRSVVTQNAGSIRLGHLWKGSDGRRGVLSTEILVALPYYPEIAVSLQRLLLEGLRKPGSVLNTYTFKIKPHPYLKHDAVLRDEFRRHRNCSFTSGDLGELLKTTGLLITSSSTVVFDSACSGCKTLYFVPERLSEGTDFLIREHLFVAYEYNFEKVLLEALASEKRPRIIVKDYFSEPDYNKFVEHIGASPQERV